MTVCLNYFVLIFSLSAPLCFIFSIILVACNASFSMPHLLLDKCLYITYFSDPDVTQETD